MDQLFDLAGLAVKVFAAAGVEYRVVGGVAVYLYVEEAEPDAGRLTRDLDVAIRRQDLERIAAAARGFGLEHRHAAGVDMLVMSDEPSARRAIHLVFAGERIREDYTEPAPEIGAAYRTLNGLKLIPLADLVRMKLTSFRSKDETHVKDMDEAGLITAEIEAELPQALRARLLQARARD